jgi:hypothetical protein
MRKFLHKIGKLGLLSLLLAGPLNAEGYFENDGYCEQTCCQNSSWFSLDRLAVRAEGLYWKATEDNLSFAQIESVSGTFSFTPPLTEAAKGFFKKEELDFKWKPGFRLTVDYALPCNCWDTDFNWTHFIDHASGSASAPDLVISSPTPLNPTATGTILLPTFLPVNPFSAYSNIHSRWNLQFNNYEWDIGRNICFCDCIGFRPYIGLKWERFKQKLNIEYVVNADPAHPTDDFGSVDQRILSYFSGFGIQGGFDVNWFMGCGFSLFSNVSGGVAYGRAKVNETLTENIIVPDEGTINNVIKYKDSTHIARPNIDFTFGLRWEYLLQDCYLVDFQAAWEYHHYFDQNFFRMVQDNDSARGSLTMHGVTFGAGVAF